MKASVAQLLRQAFARAKESGELVSPSLPALVIETPRDPSHGELSTNVAMRMARQEKKSPQAVAQILLEHLEDKQGVLAGAEIAGPGFLNFRFTPKFWWERLREAAAAGEGFGPRPLGARRRVQVEFVSANPTGPLHFGHARGAVVGDVLCRLLLATGHEVVREYYVNDAGNQIELLGRSVYARYQQLAGRPAEVPEEGYGGEYVRDVARRIMREEGDRWLTVPEEEACKELGMLAAGLLLEQIKNDLSHFGVRFDRFVSERRLRDAGEVERALQELEHRGLIYEQDGARWFRSTRFGDDKDRPVVKSGGDYTYFAVDVAYHRRKMLEGYDTVIDIWGADHHGHVKRLREALRALGFSGEKLEVLLVQMVSLSRGGEPVRMGKRSGEFVTMREVVEEVGSDAARFFLLMRKPDAHLDFDLELAKKQSSENPVYYVQYLHARVASILRTAAQTGIVPAPPAEVDVSLLSSGEEIGLIRHVARFPEVVEDAAVSREPHRLAFFLLELAGDFHRYYNTCRVVTEDLRLTQARLLLVIALQRVVRGGLGLLGITAPESM